MSYEDVQKAYIAFWDMRKIVKEQQRQELEERTAPERAILKAAIEKHRSDSGDSIQAIAEFLDTKNPSHWSNPIQRNVEPPELLS